MAETETKVDIPQPMEIEKKVEKTEDKAPEVPEKSSKKSKKSKKEKKSRKNRSRSRSDSESTGESKSRERKASRSKSKSRSRSSTRKSHRRSKKEKRSKKHRRSHSSESRSASSRSRSKSHSPRRRKHRRDSSYERRRRDRNNRSRDRGDDRRRRNDREHRPPRDRRRRSGTRSRSPHPLLRGAVSNHQESSVRNKIEDANKSKMFWDGFQWVAKVNTTGNVDPAVLAQTKKMRRLVISNLPLTLGIGENEVGDFVTKFIVENYLNDEGNFHPVKEVTIDTAKNSATIELSSVEEANKLAKVEAIKILGSNCRVAKVGDPKLNSTVGNLITDAQYSGQAAAAALAALTMLSNKGTDASFTLSKVNVLGSTSKILKVTNLVDPEHAKVITPDEVQEIYEDISGEFGTIGKVVESFIVKKEKATSGAEVGTVFLIFEETSGAEKAYNMMSNKRYENRDIRITYIDEETYKKSFAHLKA